MKCTKEMSQYFKELEKGCLKAFNVASKARKAQIDPVNEVEITLCFRLLFLFSLSPFLL